MKVVGLITEYNPFHNGHLYHIRKSKEISGADAVIVVMSGNFVQRGVPSIMPKHIRTEIALEAGVGVVLELPVCFSTGSAEYFAAGAVSLLDGLGCVDAICFGSECGDLELLENIARVTAEEPHEYICSLKENLCAGMSFPLARQTALKDYFKDETLTEILEQPNNILGIEYIKALRQQKSTIQPYTIRRMVSGYHDDSLQSGYSSASAIRKLLAHAGSSIHLEDDNLFDEPSLSEVLGRLESQVPKACIRFLEETHYTRYPIYANDFSALLRYKLFSETPDSLTDYLDINADLANRIFNHIHHFITIDQFCDLLKTKDTTHSRISRSLFHILLDIRGKDMDTYRNAGICQYARLLGFRRDYSHLLTQIKTKSSLPLITKLTQTDRLSDPAKTMLNGDIFAADLYESIVTDKFKMPFISEYRQQIVKI